MRLRLVVAAVFLLVAAFAGCGDDDDGGGNRAAGRFRPRQAGVLTVATDLPAPGFWDGTDPQHIGGGLEYALAWALADRFDLDRVEVVNVPFDQLVAGEARGFDLALAQVSITRARAEVVDLSVPYLTTPVGVLGRPGEDIPDLEAARSRRWGVAEATTEVDLLDDRIRPEEDPQVYPTTAEAVAAVADGEVDVAAVDLARAMAEAADDDRLALVAQITAPQHYGALLPEGSSNTEAVNSAIRSLAADGTLRDLTDALYDRYDVDTNNLPTIRVSS